MKKLFPLLLLFSSLLACAAAQAAILTVNSAADAANQSGVCTLRDAMASVNNGTNYAGGCAAQSTGLLGSSDAIVFDSSVFNGAHTIHVANGGQIEIQKDLAITGVRFVNGDANSGNGGAVEVTASNHTLTLARCAFEGNKASYGGAVWANTANIANIANIANSTFSGNSASSGGAVYAYSSAIADSTFSGNSASGNSASGNSAYYDGGAVFAANLHARHLTLLNNTAGNSGQAVCVSMYYSSSTLHNSIFIGGNNQPQCVGYSGGSGGITGSHNLEGWADASGVWQASGISCGGGSPVTVTGTPALSTLINTTLANHGGPTPTLALPTGSPAIGAADPTGGTSQMWDFAANGWTDATLDQRGSARKAVGSGRDVGAYEYNNLGITGAMPDGMVGAPYAGGGVTASGAATPTYTITGGALPLGLSLGSGTGAVTGTPMQAGTYYFVVTATDSAALTSNLTGMGFTVTIWSELVFTPATLPDGQAGAAYPDTFVGTVSGGKPNYTFSISSGAVPLGMWLEAGGTLRGTPDASAVGHHTFEVTVTDAEGYTAAESLALTIAPAPPPPAASIPTLPAPLLPALVMLVGAAAAWQRRR